MTEDFEDPEYLAAIRELWERGDTDYRLEPQQLELIEGIRQADVEIVYADFTRRGGKTDTCATYCDQEARKQKLKVRYATAFQTDLVEFIKPAFDTMLEDCPEDLKPEYLESKKVYIYPTTKSEIKLVGLDKNPNGLRGNGLRIIVIDEAGFVSNLEYLYKSVIIPATARRKGQIKQKIKIIVISSPPPSAERHFAYEMKKKAKEQKNGFYLCKTLDEIDAIPDEEKERLLREAGGRNSVTAQREFFCKWIVDVEQAVCPTFDIQKHVKHFEEPTHTLFTFSCDIGGVNDKTAAYVGCWSHELKKVLILCEEEFEPGTPSSVITAKLKEQIGERKVTKYADGGGQTRVDWMKDHQFSCALPPKDEFHAGLTMLRTAFANDEVLIHPTCRLLIKTLATGLLNKSRTDFERAKDLGHCDAAAALIYLLRTVNRTTDARPSNERRSTHNTVRPKKAHPLTKTTYRG